MEKRSVLIKESLVTSVASEIHRVEQLLPSKNFGPFHFSGREECLIRREVEGLEESLRQIIDAYDSKKIGGDDTDHQSFQDWWSRGEDPDAINGNSNSCYGSYYSQMLKNIEEANMGYAFLQDSHFAEARKKIVLARAMFSKKRASIFHTISVEKRTLQKKDEKFLRGVIAEMEALGVKGFRLSQVPCCGLERAIKIAKGELPQNDCYWIFSSEFASFDELLRP